MGRRKMTKSERNRTRVRELATRDLEQLFAKKQRKESKEAASTIISQTKNELIKSQSSNKNEIIDSDLRFVFEPLVIDFIVENEQAKGVDLIGLTDLEIEEYNITENWLIHLDEITKRIKILELNQLILSESIRKLNKLARDWQTELGLTKQVIVMYYDIISETGQKLALFDRIDRSQVFFQFLQIRNLETDVREKLIRTEGELGKEKEKLLNIQKQILDVILVIRVKRDLYENLQKFLESYRVIRHQVVENYRFLRKAVKEQNFAQKRELFIENSTSTVNTANENLDVCVQRLDSSQTFLREQYLEFEKFEKDALEIDRSQYSDKFDEFMSNLEYKYW